MISQGKQKGSALVLTVILLAVISVMTVSMMFLSQSETWSTANYRLMSQARDGAEAGINRAANHLINTYAPPVTAADLALFNRNLYPVRVVANGRTVVLSADSDITDNYPAPLAAEQDAFDAGAQDALAAGNQTVNYETSARLLTMRQINVYAVGPNVIQRWEIASKGSIGGIQNALVEVSAVLDRTTAPAFSYAAFGTSEECDPPGLTFGGNSNTDSYDSGDYDPTTCSDVTDSLTCGALENSGGNLGTNGSLDVVGGSVTIHGSLSTPRTGTGSCEEDFATDNPDALEADEPLVQLTQLPEFEDPAFPNPTPLLVDQTLPNNGVICPAIVGCTGLSKNNFALAPGTYGNLSGGGGAAKTIHLSAGTYNINSLDLGGNVTVIIDNGPVILNIAGCVSFNGDVPPTGCAAYMDTPLATNGGSFTNDSMVASDLQIWYAGEGNLEMAGTSGLAAVVYAPSAHFETVGTTDFYGAVIAHTIDLTGTANIHYDRALENGDVILGSYMLQAFTWKKF
ncbi:MAG: pilus assembly PilX N-terminal domain-containing protein [Acidobacteria bacterium]|nr:pilus assembly PilX N-terminal domain-containing protein [Acidobacteriota bacterium]